MKRLASRQKEDMKGARERPESEEERPGEGYFFKTKTSTWSKNELVKGTAKKKNC